MSDVLWLDDDDDDDETHCKGHHVEIATYNEDKDIDKFLDQ